MASFTDATGAIGDTIVTVNDGRCEFRRNGGSTSVWVEQYDVAKAFKKTSWRITVSDSSIQPDEFVNNPDLLKQFLELWNLAPSPKGEAAAWIVRITVPKLAYKLINHKTNSNNHVSLGSCHRSAVAQVHTHYHGLDPKPSTWGDADQHDWFTATRCNVPVYVLSSFAIWKVLPGGKTPTLIKVANKWF